MLCFWASKGGSGCSTVAASCALHAAVEGRTLLVDLDGVQPTLLGVTVDGPGIVRWSAAPAPPPDALARIEVAVTPHLSLLPLGPPASDGDDRSGAGRSDAVWRLLAHWLRADDRRVVVDLGSGPGVGHGWRADLRAELLGATTRSYLVTRACYLAVVAATEGPGPDGVVVVREPGRALRDRDIAGAIGAPVVATIPWDPAVARAVDAGTITRRQPRPLLRLRPLAVAPTGPDGSAEAPTTPAQPPGEGLVP